jgi:hypothetical protein
MANTVYDNFFLSNEIEDQYNSHLDLQQFCTVDNNLTGTAGMVRKIHVYKATDGTEKLTMGNGNTKTITAGYTEKEYRILLAQNRFQYYDEEEMTDPMVVTTGTRHAGVDLFNTVNGDIYAAFNEATLTIVTTAIGFDAFVDAAAMLNLENLEGVTIFGFINPSDMGKVRKALKDDLKYVEAFARSGYVGTVGGINLYTKKDATTSKITIATKEAVTLFNKKGTEVEQERDGNTRQNTIYSRKYYLAAMTDETKAVMVITGSATATTDTTVQEDTTYYAKSGVGYVKVTPADGDNPQTKGWYEITVS